MNGTFQKSPPLRLRNATVTCSRKIVRKRATQDNFRERERDLDPVTFTSNTINEMYVNLRELCRGHPSRKKRPLTAIT